MDRKGRATIDVWGDMPRDIQEALFETAMKGTTPSTRSSRACCTTVIPGPCIRRSRTEEPDFAGRVYSSRQLPRGLKVQDGRR
jgi:hypothetical protein